MADPPEQFFDPSYWTLMKGGIRDAIRSILDQKPVTAMTKTFAVRMSYFACPRFSPTSATQMIHSNTVLKRRPRPQDEDVYNEAKAAVEELVGLIEAASKPAASGTQPASGSALATAQSPEDGGRMSVDQEDQDSTNGRQRRSSKGDSVEQHPSSGDASAVSEFNLQEALELVDGYITRHAEVVPLTREVIKNMHLAGYQQGLGLYKNWFGDRALG
jgi:hypothetical protein